MEESVLTATKKTLGIDESYEAFDQDILIFINSAFSSLFQLGVGPQDQVFLVTDKDVVWAGFSVPTHQLGMVKPYVYLKTRLLFDPPATSYTIAAFEKQLSELEWRLNCFAEQAIVDGAIGDLDEELRDFSEENLHEAFEEIVDPPELEDDEEGSEL